MPMNSLPLLADFTSDEEPKKSKTPLTVSLHLCAGNPFTKLYATTLFKT